MNVLFVIIFVLFIIGYIVCLNYTVKYFKIKKELDVPIRTGYYDGSLIYGKEGTEGYLEFKPRIYIKEIDRYTDGDSKISIIKIEPRVSENKVDFEKVRRYINDTFSEIMKTNEITWLESENEVKRIRKQKLEKIVKKKLF